MENWDLKNTVSETKYSIDSIDNQMEMTEESICKRENKSVEIVQQKE